MIREYFSGKEEILISHPAVVSFSFDSTATDEDRGFWKAKASFRDGLELHLFEYVIIEGGEVSVEKYRYHFQDSDEEMVFRFDDASHHPEVDTHPEHKHERDEIVAAERPEIQEVLDLVVQNDSQK